jgi:hypothetical protein
MSARAVYWDLAIFANDLVLEADKAKFRVISFSDLITALLVIMPPKY